MIEIDPARLEELAALLRERVGLHVRPDGLPGLRLALQARLEEAGAPAPDAASYVRLLGAPGGDEELRRLLPLVTVGKTGFFRDERQFDALAALLPGLLERSRRGGAPSAIWSAGCATGEEPYSIAIAAAEAGARPGELELLATDLNPEAVAAAAGGRFDERRTRGLPLPLRERHLEPDGDGWRVGAPLRALVTAIRTHNLAAAGYPLPAAGAWDAIFCRNVIIYFDTATTRRVLAQLLAALRPGGYLFLGYSESLFRLFDGFDLTEVAGAFLYRKPEGAVRTPSPERPAVPVPSSPPEVHRLPRPAAPGVGGAPGGPPAGPLAPQEYLDGAVALFAEGRFGAARELLERHLERDGEDLAMRLTLANLYGVLRQLDRARDSYLAALVLEPLSAEAHLFFGIHLLAAGEVAAAARELARALFLDPDLALGHYYLGRCREAERDLPRARLAYRNAIEAHRRLPSGKRQAFLGYYPDIPDDGAAFARAAAYALAAL